MAERKVSILLSGGVDNRTADELTSPVATQGKAITLKASRNTRLGVLQGGVVRSPAFTSITSLTNPTRARAIVSAAAGRSTLVLPDQDFRSFATMQVDAGRKEPGITYGALGGTASDNQTGSMPVQVSSSRGLSSALAVGQFAMTYHASSGLLYYAYIANDGDNNVTALDRLVIGALTLDGSAVVPPREVATFTPNMSRWVGLTAHGANGVCLWYQNVALGAVCYRTVSYAGTLLTVGAENQVLVPGNTTYSLDVVRGDDTYALLAHSRVGVAADGSVSKVNITNNTFASVNIVNALNGGGHVAIQCDSPEGTAVVAVVFASTTAGTARVYCYTFATMANISTSGALTCDGRVSIGFSHNDALSSGAVAPTISVMLERGAAVSAMIVQSLPGVDHYVIDQPTGTFTVATRLPWYRIAGRAAQWTTSAQMMQTVHQLVPRRALTLENPGEENYTDDPSLDLYWVRTQSTASLRPGLLARLGVVRGGSAPVDHLYADKLSSSSLLCVGNELYAAYRLLADYSSASNGATRGRLTTVSLGTPAGQFSTAHDRDGCGYLACAAPLQWDGVALSEFGGPVHTPQLFANVGVAAIGALLPAGIYSFQAVLFWTDASGMVHRSRPSPLRTVDLDGVTERVELICALPPSALTTAYEARIYATETNGTTLHLMAKVTFRSGLGDACYVTGATAVTTANAQIYSGGGLGEEIVPQAPPPAWDVAIIGQRCWIVDAEIRSRAVPSKLRVAGVGYEFSPGIEVILPSGAGKMMAVREWQGMPLILAERGVYQVSGDGPTNTLGGPGAFSAPVKVSDLGCSNTASIVQFPGGIMWQSGNRFVVLDGRGLRYVTDFECTHDVSAALCLERYSEVLLFSATTTEVRVYHHETGRWTTWDTQTLPELVQAAHVLPWDADAAVLQLGAGPTTLRRLDASSVSSATNVVLETDWLLLGDDFQSEVDLKCVVFNGRRSGSYAGGHNLQIDLFADYSTVAHTMRSWTDAELDVIDDAGGRYTVKVESALQVGCRAVKVRITDTRVATYGCSPRALTILYSVEGALLENAFVQGSFK